MKINLLKYKNFFNDSMWSILGLTLMNLISQFVVYPVWHNYYGDEIYGHIIYVMSIINIFSVAIGSSVNYIRMIYSSKHIVSNKVYNRFMIIASPICACICVLFTIITIRTLSIIDFCLIALLSILVMWRFYADVEYRLSLNYRGYCFYYILIGVGYLIGCLIFKATGIWEFALIPGELVGIILVLAHGKIFKETRIDTLEVPVAFYKDALFLISANLISNIIFNGDRLLLQNIVGGVAVTIYYLSSLLGKTMSLITTPLNSVIIGYLTKYDGNLKRKNMWLIISAASVVTVLFTAVCTIASHIIIPIFYPENYLLVRDYFIIANLSQVIYFISNILLTVLLRIGKSNYQLTVNIIYAFSFLLLCIPCTMCLGIEGFCVSLLVVNIIKFFICSYLCLKHTSKDETK